MKKVLLFTVFFLLCSGIVYADTVVLNSTETVPSAPSNIATRVVWNKVIVRPAEKTCLVEFKWRDSAGNDIGDWKYFQCRDYANQSGQLLNADCTAIGAPYECCYGNQVGVCQCFSDTFGFIVRTQDVGTKIGIGFRQLIWNQFKKVFLGAGNDGTFQ